MKCSCLILIIQIAQSIKTRYNPFCTLPICHNGNSTKVQSIVHRLSLIGDVQRLNQKEDTNDTLENIKFHINQYQNLLDNLIIPSIKERITGNYAHIATNNTPIVKKEKATEWEYKISTSKEPITCSIISNVNPGTVMMRPLGTVYDYVALTALTNLYHHRPNILKVLYPNDNINNLNGVYKYASSHTLLVRLMVSNACLRKSILLSVLVGGLRLSSSILLDVLSLLLRSGVVWDPRAYNLWSRVYHAPIPMFLLTLRKVVYTLIDGISVLDDAFKELLLEIEGTMLNHDVKTKKSIDYVSDNNGRTFKHRNYF